MALLLAVLLLAPCRPFDQEHRAFSALLARHVRSGMVDYAGFDRGSLASYLGCLESVEPVEHARWTAPQRLAYWINLYNAAVLRLVLGHWPVASIQKIEAAFQRPLVRSQVLGGTVSLDRIEHEVLRKQFAEPRIHFALVCAARGCPPLRGEAYRASKIGAQLDDAARRFVRGSRHDRASRTLYVSRIFEWYGQDFGDVRAYLARYADSATQEALRRGLRIDFLDYDWSINAR